MADHAAGLLRALDVLAARVAGFSMGGAIALELALRHPGAVRSLVLVNGFARLDALQRAQVRFWRGLGEATPSDPEFLRALFTWIYTPRAHAEETVDQIGQEALEFPHKQSVTAFEAQVDACLAHDALDRLWQIQAPTLVLRRAGHRRAAALRAGHRRRHSRRASSS